jgi:glycosyltransferase involved in cell wall biosynthesis
MKKDSPKKLDLIAVLGMHRSGTSAITRGLQALGVELGTNLMPPVDNNNSKGFFEDLDVVNLNISLFNHLGLDWHHASPVTDSQVQDLHESGYLLKAESLIREKTNSKKPYGIKDPRLSKLMPFWKEVFQYCQLDVGHIIAFRNPISVARSLSKRDGFSFEKSYLLWLEHVLAALMNTEGANRIVVDFDLLMGNPAREIERIAKAFELPVDPNAMLEYASEFLDENLRRNIDQPQDLAIDPRISPLICELYSMLREAAKTERPLLMKKDDLAYFEKGRNNLCSSMVYVDRLHQAVAERDVKLVTLNQAVAERDVKLVTLNQAVAERDMKLVALNQAVAERDGQITALQLVIESAKAWQKRSWAKRTFHKWRPPTGGWKKMSFFKKLERSIRKRRNRLLGRPSVGGSSKLDIVTQRSLLSKNDGSFHTKTMLHNDEWSRLARQAKAAHIRGIENPPTISVVMPTYNTKSEWLHKAICSVLNQTYPHWQLCIADDASTAPQVREILNHYCTLDSRIRVVYRTVCGNISAASNSALELATGDFVALLDHDDTLEPHALERCAETIITTAADVIYTDQDTLTDEGRVLWTFHKPDWSPEYLRHVMYVGHLLIVRSTLVRRLGGFCSDFDGVQDFEFMLRLSEATNRIVHISEVLYHWHAVDGSIAASTTAKVGIADKQVRAVQSYLDRNAISAIATKHPTLPHRCRIKPVLNDYPRVTIIIPSKDQADIIKVCLDSIYNKTTYPNFEVIVVDSGTTQPEALEVLASHPVRVVPLERQFNFSAACNLGAKMASGAILVFLNNDTEVITEDWLEHLVFHLTAEDVGAVGPLLLYPDGKVQHAGVVLGARGTADHVMRHFPADSDGYAGSLSCPHEVSAVTGACLAVKKSTFLEIEEFSELYVTHYQDVDLCLKLRQRSLRCIFTPEARLFHHESLSRGQNSYDFLDRLLLIDSWREVLSTSDPYYPKQFSIDRLDYSIN